MLHLQTNRGNGQECKKTILPSSGGWYHKGTCELSATEQHELNVAISNDNIDQQQYIHTPNERLSPDKVRSIQSQPNTFIIDLQHQQQSLQQQQK